MTRISEPCSAAFAALICCAPSASQISTPAGQGARGLRPLFSRTGTLRPSRPSAGTPAARACAPARPSVLGYGARLPEHLCHLADQSFIWMSAPVSDGADEELASPSARRRHSREWLAISLSMRGCSGAPGFLQPGHVEVQHQRQHRRAFGIMQPFVDRPHSPRCRAPAVIVLPLRRSGG